MNDLTHRVNISLELARSPRRGQDGLVYLSQRDVIELLDRIRELEAENARLNMEMAAYRQGCTPKDAAAMLAVKDALDAEKQRLSTTSQLSECPVCRRPLDADEVYGSCANTKDGHHRRVRGSDAP